MKHRLHLLTLAVAITLANAAHAQIKGPSTGSTPYILPLKSGIETYSILTVDNTGANPDDSIGGYGMVGIPDGLGAYDNGNGTFTLLMNHELGNTLGVTRAHGAAGAFVSEWVINKNTFQVISGADLMTSIYGWNTTTQSSNTTATVGGFAFSRFCSADLAAPTAYFNATSGLGSTARIFMHGEEGSATGLQQATIATGADKGKSYTLGKFNLSTNGSGLTGVGAWENSVANPFAQDKTIVASGNDGGTGIMSNSVSIYVGTKTNSGSEVDKAGLTNGTLKFVSVTGNTAEITNATTRTTGITSGTAFTLSDTASTTFSRPEDIAWNTTNSSQLYFVTTDRLDQVSDGVGTQIGQSRLWRLNFSDITNPGLGGTIDLLVDGDVVGGKKVNMFDNITVGVDGTVYLQEDVGNAAHNGKIWAYYPGTDTLELIAGHDTARFGDIGIAATSPYTVDEEGSGIIDITALMAGSALNTGLPGEKWFLSSDQAHYTTGITAAQVEGGQLVAIHVVPEPSALISMVGGLGMVLTFRRRRA